MFQKEWDVLLVDDEPDILDVSKLVMRKFKVYGLPLKIHTSESKAEAIENFRSAPEFEWNLSVAFIDVVMESDTAGLELCQHIREQMGNKLVRLFIRTGQPGVAPEREVLDNYDVDGYFTKMEATKDKLYSLVKSGISQFLWSQMSLSVIWLLDAIISHSDSQEKMLEQFRFLLGGFGVEDDFPRYVSVGDKAALTIGIDEKRGLEIRQRLDKFEGKLLSPNGDKYVRDEENYQLIKVAQKPSNVEVCFLFKTAFSAPAPVITMVYHVFNTYNDLPCFHSSNSFLLVKL